jgi:hypothetical protein
VLIPSLAWCCAKVTSGVVWGETNLCKGSEKWWRSCGVAHMVSSLGCVFKKPSWQDAFEFFPRPVGRVPGEVWDESVSGIQNLLLARSNFPRPEIVGYPLLCCMNMQTSWAFAKGPSRWVPFIYPKLALGEVKLSGAWNCWLPFVALYEYADQLGLCQRYGYRVTHGDLQLLHMWSFFWILILILCCLKPWQASIPGLIKGGRFHF